MKSKPSIHWAFIPALFSTLLGVVLLTGSVSAQTADIQASPGIPAPTARPDATLTGMRLPDEDIALAIYRALYYDHRVVSALAQVQVTNGVAVLTGSVPTLAGKQAAEQIAGTAPGVTRVVDLLEVAPLETAPTDEQIYRNVRHALNTDTQVYGYPIKVGVVNGHVYLAGTVDTVFARAKAANLAGAVPGVTTVANALTVPQTYHLYETWTPGSFYGKPKPPSDEDIRKRLDTQLSSNPLVEGRNLHSETRDRVVTLMGTVSNDAERNAAVHSAYEAGAKEVRDQLKILPPDLMSQK